MANETVSLELLIEAGNSAKTLGDLKANFTKLNEEIEKVDAGSEEFRKLQTAITKTGSKVKNLELSLESLDKEQVASAIGGVAGGIGDITTAMVILGGENENLEVMVNNISNAMAVSMGLKGAIEGMSDGYKLVNNLMKTNAIIMRLVATTSKILRVALIATGVGAIVVLLGVLATNLDTVKNGFKSLGDYLMKYFNPQIQAVKWLFKEVSDYIQKEFAPIIAGVTKLLEEFGLKETEVAKKTREANEVILKSYQDRSKELKALQAQQKKIHDLSIAQMNREIDLAKANGKDVTELEKERMMFTIENARLEVEAGRQRIFALKDEAKTLKELNSVKQEMFDDLGKRAVEERDTLSKSKEFLKDAENAYAVFEATIRTDKANKDKEAYNKRKAERETEQAEELADEKKHQEDLAKARKEQLQSDEEWLKEFNTKRKENKEATRIETQNETMRLEAEEEARKDLKRLNDIEKEKKHQAEKKQAVIKGLQDSQNSLNALTSINEAFLNNDLANAGNNEAKKEQLRKASFERQKKINVALAIIDGAKAVTSIIAQYPKFDGGIAMAGALASAVIATGSQLALIKNTKYNSSGSSVPNLSTGSNTSSAGGGVGINPVSNTSTVVGDQKVFVTESDITTVQNTVSVIEAQSKF
jgi:hypothetical protein